VLPKPLGQTVPHTQPATVTLSAVDGDGKPVTYSAQVQAYNPVKQQFALAAPPGSSNYYFNYRNAQEKYLVSTNGSNAAQGGWYFLLPNGSLYAWDGNSLTTSEASAAAATVSAATYSDPTQLFTTSPPTGVTATVNSSTLAVNDVGFAGTVQVAVTASDGTLTDTKTFLVTFTDANAPTLAPITTPPPFSHTTTPPTIALTGGDADGAADIANLVYSAKVYQDTPAYLAFTLQQTYGLFSPGNNYYFNYRGQNEKYLQGSGNQWYYLLPTGALYQWGLPSSTLLTTRLPTAFWSNPDLLWNAQAPADAAQAYATQQAYGLVDPGNNFYSNLRGQNEKYLLSSSGQWYFLMPTGALYRWGGTIAASTLMTTINTTFYSDPSVLINAQALAEVSSTYVTVSGNGSINGRLNFTSAISSFTGTLHVQVSDSDGILASPSQLFDVIVT
jgi:hypothetical protein